jgi:nucleoside-diphosphate-sugar epimerase
VVNVASGRDISLLDLVDALNQLLHTNLAAEFAPPRLGDIQHSRGDNSKGLAVLNFQPAISFVDGLKHILNYRHSDGI